MYYKSCVRGEKLMSDMICRATAGTLESSDVFVTLEPHADGLQIEIDSVVKNQFGEEIRRTVEEVLAGKYHGHGEDYTEQIRTYLDDIITSGAKERIGCVVVTEELAQLLQMIMDKYTFQNVDHSWTKVCYYYDYLGRQ